MSVSKTTKSDELVSLRKIFSGDGLFSRFNNLVQVNLILDANAVLADLRWLVCKAKKPNARTNLMEAIDAETIIAYAPTYLHIEILKNIPIIAKEEKVDDSLFLERWGSYKEKISFVEMGGPEESSIDPKDVPYVKLHEDPHIYKMGAKVVSVNITAFALNYSRNAAIEYKIKVGALGVFTLSQGMIDEASKLLRSLDLSLQKIPMWAWLLLITGFVFALSIESIRFWLIQKLESFSEATKKHSLNLIKILEPLVAEHYKSQSEANLAKEAIGSELN